MGHDSAAGWVTLWAPPKTKPTIFLADGSDHIWRLQERYFPQAEVCLDWFHVMEKLWSAGGCVRSEGSEPLRKWVADRSERLRKGQPDEVLEDLRQQRAAVPRTGPGTRGKRERLDATIRYLSEHRKRLRYAELRERDLDIGSGAVEGAVRNLIGLRLDGPGMRWSRQRSERILHLRCVLLNGQWDHFTDSIASQKRLRLAAQPEPTTTHTAKAAA